MCHDSFKQHIYTLPPSWPVCLKNFLQRWNRSDDMRSHANDDEEMCWHWFKIFSDTRSLIPDHNYWSEKCTLSVSFGLSLFKDTTEWSWHWLYVCPKPLCYPCMIWDCSKNILCTLLQTRKSDLLHKWTLLTANAIPFAYCLLVHYRYKCLFCIKAFLRTFNNSPGSTFVCACIQYSHKFPLGAIFLHYCRLVFLHNVLK